MLFSMLILILGLTTTGLAMIQPIPREVQRQYVNEGTFEGGKPVDSIIANIRMGNHPREGYERWVVDFMDPNSKVIGQTAPRFSVRYAREQIGVSPVGEESVLVPARIILSVRQIKETQISESQLVTLASKSGLVKELILHPPIESGDRVIEWVLNQPGLFEAHQPKNREGRLVLDLKAPPGE